MMLLPHFPLLIASPESAPAWITTIFAVLLGALITCLALEEKLQAKKSVIAGVFAIACLLLGGFFGLLPFEPVLVGSHEVVEHPEFVATIEDGGGHVESVTIDPDESIHDGGYEIHMPVYIPAIDWGVITVILGSTLFVDITSKSGLFTWIAIKVTKASGGDPLKLLVFYGLMTVVFSAVLNNVTAMVIVGSLTAVSLTKLDRRDKLLSFLLVEGLLTNIGGLLTLISSVPNIIIGTTANISFVEFFYKSAPFVVVATLATLVLGAWKFKIRRLHGAEAIANARELVASFDERDGIESWGFFWFGAAMLVLFILTIAATSVLPVVSDLQMGFVAMMFAGIMLVRYRSTADEFYRAIDWDLIGFFIALFIVINVMEHAGVLASIGKMISSVLEWPAPKANVAVLTASAGFSSVTDNIPLAAMLSKILAGLGTPINTATTSASPIWWAVIFGSNLGGNLTPIGSASTLVSVTLIHRHHLQLSFAGFVKKAFPFALLHILLAIAYVLLVLQ
jgi:Na+/H+ antiporter NhaD/arsenite permease-like protein